MTEGREEVIEDKAVKGTRRARRVSVKLRPAGPGDKLRQMWRDGHGSTNEAMATAGAALVALGRKPNLAAVIEYIEEAGGTLSPATAGRHTTALAEARAEWESLHGRVPEWHRKRDTDRDESDKPAAPTDGAREAGEEALRKAEARLERVLTELAKCNASRERLAAENAELRETVRRLELDRGGNG